MSEHLDYDAILFADVAVAQSRRPINPMPE